MVIEAAPATLTAAPQPKARTPRVRELAIFAGVVFLAYAFRIWRLPEVPSGMLWDEGAAGIDQVPLFHGQFPVFFPAHSGHEALLFYAQAASKWAFGWTVFAHRLPAVFFTTIAVAGCYAVARRLFGSRVAAISTLLMAVTLWSVEQGRLARTDSALPPVEVLAVFWLYLWLVGRRPWLSAALCGLFMGLVFHAYVSGRFLIFVLALGWLWAFVHFRERRTTLVKQGVVFLGPLLLVVAPLGWFFLSHPRSFNERQGELSIFNPAYGAALPNWLHSVKATVLMFAVSGEAGWDKNIAGKPIFNPVLALLAIAGLAIAIRHIRRLEYFLALTWAVLLLAPMTLTVPDMPDFGRAIGAAPAVYFFPALAAAALWKRGRAWQYAILCGCVAYVGVSYWDYFGIWANAPGRAAVYRPGVLNAGQSALDRLLAPDPPQWLYFGTRERFDAITDFEIAGFQTEHPGVASRVIGYHAIYTQVLPPAGSESYLIVDGRPAVTSLPTPSQPLSTSLGGVLSIQGVDLPATSRTGAELTLSVEWRPERAYQGSVTLFAHLLDYSRRTMVATFDHNGFPATAWRGGETVLSNFPLAVPASAAPGVYWIELGAYGEHQERFKTSNGDDHVLLGPVVLVPSSPPNEPPVAQIDGEIGLLPATVRRSGDGIDVDLRWLPEKELDENYSVFLHVLDSGGRLVAQSDGAPAGGEWPTQYWVPHIPVNDSRHIVLPKALPAGEYQLTAGFYRLASGARLPTAPVGPEPGSVLVASAALG